MSADDFALKALAETTATFVRSVKADECNKDTKKHDIKDKNEKRISILRRVQSLRASRPVDVERRKTTSVISEKPIRATTLRRFLSVRSSHRPEEPKPFQPELDDSGLQELRTNTPKRGFLQRFASFRSTRTSSHSYTNGGGTYNENEIYNVNSGKKKRLLGRFSSFRSTGSVRSDLSLKSVNCFSSEDGDEEPIMEVPRHKSIDIGVGLARKMSLFLFTKKSVCMHPYHPFTPHQTTRKIYTWTDEK